MRTTTESANPFTTGRLAAPACTIAPPHTTTYSRLPGLQHDLIRLRRRLRAIDRQIARQLLRLRILHP